MAERDDILYSTAHSILNVEGELQTTGMVARVVMVIEFHNEDGKPFVRAVSTHSSEWWHTLGLLTVAERLLTPGNDPIDVDWNK